MRRPPAARFAVAGAPGDGIGATQLMAARSGPGPRGSTRLGEERRVVAGVRSFVTPPLVIARSDC